VRLVLEGRRHLGQQVMEFVMASGKPISARVAEERFSELLTQLIEVESRK
jgi:hypothetical protein